MATTDTKGGDGGSSPVGLLLILGAGAVAFFVMSGKTDAGTSPGDVIASGLQTGQKAIGALAEGAGKVLGGVGSAAASVGAGVGAGVGGAFKGVGSAAAGIGSGIGAAFSGIGGSVGKIASVPSKVLGGLF